MTDQTPDAFVINRMATRMAEDALLIHELLTGNARQADVIRKLELEVQRHKALAERPEQSGPTGPVPPAPNV